MGCPARTPQPPAFERANIDARLSLLRAWGWGRAVGRDRHCERQTAPGFSTQLLRGEMRNCLSDPKPEFTAALHYRFLQEALGEARCGEGSPVSSCCLHKHVGGFLPGAAGRGQGTWAAQGSLPASLRSPPPPPLPVYINSAEGGRHRSGYRERKQPQVGTEGTWSPSSPWVSCLFHGVYTGTNPHPCSQPLCF